MIHACDMAITSSCILTHIHTHTHTLTNKHIRRDLLTQASRNFKELFVGMRERANRVLGFAKILRKVCNIGLERQIRNIARVVGLEAKLCCVKVMAI